MLSYPGGASRLSLYESEEQRVAFLRKPIPATMNDPRLTQLVKVRVLRPFWVNRVLAVPDAIVTVPAALAEDLRTVGRAERLD